MLKYAQRQVGARDLNGVEPAGLNNCNRSTQHQRLIFDDEDYWTEQRTSNKFDAEVWSFDDLKRVALSGTFIDVCKNAPAAIQMAMRC